MAGIYIPGMEMPKSCGFCPLKMMAMEGDECAIGARFTEYQKRPSDCPLIHVPDHGDLIDRDAMIDSMKHEIQEFISLSVYDDGLLNGYKAATRKIQENAPTIISADHFRGVTKMVSKDGTE